jgi:hypothetical protein
MVEPGAPRTPGMPERSRACQIKPGPGRASGPTGRLIQSPTSTTLGSRLPVVFSETGGDCRPIGSVIPVGAESGRGSSSADASSWPQVPASVVEIEPALRADH